MGLPPTSAPLTPGLNFATINAETLEAAQQEMEFKVPEEKFIDKVRGAWSSVASFELSAFLKQAPHSCAFEDTFEALNDDSQCTDSDSAPT